MEFERLTTIITTFSVIMLVLSFYCGGSDYSVNVSDKYLNFMREHGRSDLIIKQ